MSSMRRRGGPLATALLLATVAAPGAAHAPAGLEVIATGVLRPLQLAVEGRTLVVLAPGLGGHSAGDLYRFDLDNDAPIDLASQPRLQIPFADARMGSLGSLAIDPRTHDLFLGEENGRRVYRLSARGELALYAIGLRRLPGGSAIAFDRLDRLVLVDYADPRTSPSEEPVPPGLEQFRDEDYRGPLVFRLGDGDTIPLPRQVSRLAPLFPRAWGGRAGGAMLPHLISVAALEGDELAFLSSGGTILRLATDRRLHPHARLPRGQYNRTNMISLPDGSLIVSGGFHVGSIFLVSPGGSVTTLASGLADPEGIAVDARRDLYIAESALHRIVRLPDADRR